MLVKINIKKVNRTMGKKRRNHDSKRYRMIGHH